MSVFRPRYQDKKTTERRRSGKCWLSFKDHKGIRRRMAALLDRRWSEALEREIKYLDFSTKESHP
jgi:hypothetical protein